LSPLLHSSIQVSSDLEELTQVLGWFDQFRQPPLPDTSWLPCQLALAEGFTNAVRHAHRNKPSGLIVDLEFQLFGDRLEIRIWDHGDPFDLIGYLEGLPAKISPEAEGGRGLKLMQRIADHLSYDRTTDQRNCLCVVKHYSPAAAEEDCDLNSALRDPEATDLESPSGLESPSLSEEQHQSISPESAS
jgi:serine/threonine-protein kinase RsbW